MSKTRDTGFLANVIQVHDTGVRIMSGSEMLMAISSSGQVTITGELSGSDAANSLLLDGTGSLAFTTTASYNAFSASYGIASASLSSRTTQVERTYASTGSNTFTGAQYISDTSNAIGFTSTASLYSDGGLRVQGNSFVSGTAYFNNIVVYGTSSIQYITSSQVNISTNIITVNTDTPAIRFGGLSVFDSGSTGLTGSILWDSEKNHWVYSNPSGSTYSGGMFISGPRSSALGSEQGTTSCMLLVGQGSDHLTSSLIYHDSARTCIPNCLIIGGAANFASSVTATQINVGTSGTSTSLASIQSPYGILSGLIEANVAGNAYYNSGWKFYSNGPAGVFNIDTSGNFGFYATGSGTAGNNLNLGTAKVFFTNSGAVGVGTTSPTARLDVYQTGNPQIVVRNADASAFMQAVGTTEAQFGSVGASGILSLYAGGDRRLNITSTGKIGIGNADPAYPLTVSATNADLISIRNGSTEVGRFGIDGATTHGWMSLWNSGAQKVQITAGTSNTFFAGTGNFGVGTNDPQGKFHVDNADTYNMGIQHNKTSTYVTETKFGRPSTSSNFSLIYDIAGTEIAEFKRNYAAAKMIFTKESTTHMEISSGGVVTIPLQPAFSMYVSSNVTGPSVVAAGGTLFNDGSHYNTSTYRFTAPVAGRYFFSFYDNIFANNTSPTQFTFRVNGTDRGAIAYTTTKTTSSWYLMSFQQVIKLNANDYVDVYNNSGDRPDYGSAAWGNFSGYLIG